MMKNILYLLATTAVLQVSAQQKRPPHQLRIYDTSDAQNHHILSGDIIYYMLDTAEKRPIKMICRAEGHPTPTYQWKKDGVVLQSSSNIGVDSTTGSLVIPDPNPTVDGYYQCFAKNDYGTGLSKIVQIVRRRLVGFGDKGRTQTVSTTVGSTFKIECSDPPVSIPAADFDWKIGEDKEEIPAAPTGRSSIDAFGTLYFIYVTKADGGQPYYCSLTNGQMTEAGRRTILTVNDGVVTPFSPRVLHVSPVTIGYRLGEATLECIFGGYPISTVTWKNKDGEEIQTQVGKYEILDHTRKLKIKDLRDDDEGMYSCKGSNNLGNLEKLIFLNVTSKPIWTQAPTDQTAPVGGLAKFHCQARPAYGETSLSPPVWFKNGAELRFSDFGEDKKFLLSDEGTVLYVQNLELEKDLMCIQCNITNDIGYQFKDASLTVIVAITIDYRPPDAITLGFGNSTELGVEATGGPYHDITYEWQHSGKPVKNNPPHVIVDANKLKIDSANVHYIAFVNMGGVYTCVITNGVQETRVDVLVTPKAEFTEVDQTPNVTIILQDILKDIENQSNPTVETALQWSVKLDKLVTHSSNLDASNVAKTSQIIDSISKVNNITSEISHNVLSTISSVITQISNANMTISEQMEAGVAESRLIMSIDTVLMNTVTNGTNWTFQTDNLKIEVEDMDEPGNYLLGVRVNAVRSNTTTSNDNFTVSDGNEVHITSIRNDDTLTVEPMECIILPFSVIDGLVRNSSRRGHVRVSTVVFTNTKLFKQTGLLNNSPTRSYKLNSKVMSAAIHVGKEAITDLNENVVAVFQPSDMMESGKPACVYWDTTKAIGEWATDGCFYNNPGDGYHRCECDHLTSFAVLMTMSGQSVNTHTLVIITKCGLGISIACVCFTLLSAILVKKLRQGKFHTTLLNLCVALLGSWIAFLVGIRRTESSYGCIATAIGLHYFIVAAFMWMLVAGYLQYLKFVRLNLIYIFKFATKAMLLSWGLPLIPVIITLSLDYKHYQSKDDFCWLSRPAFYFAFCVPVGVTVLINIGFYTIVLWKSFNRPKMQSNQKASKIRKLALRNAMALFVLLGLTWVFGFFTIEDGREVFSYIFTILNAFQGLYIFLLFIVRLDFVTQFWLSLCRKKKKARRVFVKRRYKYTITQV